MSSVIEELNQQLEAVGAPSVAALDLLTPTEASAIFDTLARPHTNARKTAWEAGDETTRLAEEAAQEVFREAQRAYFAFRKAREKAARAEWDSWLKNTPEGRTHHVWLSQRAPEFQANLALTQTPEYREACREKSLQENARRAAAGQTQNRSRDQLLRDIEEAHRNDEPLPEPIRETREQQIIGNALRSGGGYVAVNTGHALQRGKHPSSGVARPR